MAVSADHSTQSDARELHSPDSSDATGQLATVLQQYWGYPSFRPLQLEAMQAAMQGQDSLVIFPTGGGKSLCFQAPAVCLPGLSVVVSPLISLMKDQVDALQACGISAAVLNSSISAREEQEVLNRIRSGELKLLYLAPERLLTERMHELLANLKLSMFAIDEAHCVSEWGHDFRPEYRGLSILKKKYPGVAVHAYTATAPEIVRRDIICQLGLVNPNSLIGSMNRANLIYQVRQRESGLGQILEVLEKHRHESGIIYCLSKKNVDATAAALNELGLKALPYHAGMSAEERKQNQNAFLKEEVNIIVATVAFGMGIDKSNVRFVIHATMPKSVEAYQQESGRAGRDGLEAECWLFHSSADLMSWKRLLEQSESPEGRESAIKALNDMANFCHSSQCRHVALAAHFDERLPIDNCGACDVCLNEVPQVEYPLVLGQKIVSCVYRVDQRFGADYVSQVLVGSNDKRILANRHDQVSTFGLLASENRRDIRNWISQLICQDFLTPVGEYNVLNITDKGHQLLRGQLTPLLTKPANTTSRKLSGTAKEVSWEGVDRDLFEKLRALRGEEANGRSVPAYVVFSDSSLRDMARRRPSTLDSFHLISGVGSQKLTDYGPAFLASINEHCRAQGLSQDSIPPVNQAHTIKSPNNPPPKTTAQAIAAFPFFDQGLSVPETATKIGRAESTTWGYLQEYIRHHRVTDPSRWVDPATAGQIQAAIQKVGPVPLKPIFFELEEKISYNQIRVVVDCLANQSANV